MYKLQQYYSQGTVDFSILMERKTQELTVVEVFVTASCDVSIKHAQLAIYCNSLPQNMQEQEPELATELTNFEAPGPGTTQGDDSLTPQGTK
jgi:hypothetical protein